MQLICISRGSYGYGKNVAERLAEKLGYACVAREEITEEATDHGIHVGKLEVAVLKNRPLSEAMEIQMDLFKAFVSAKLCERVLQGEGVVYHGRTGHLVLPGVSQVLRVRAIADMDSRIRMAMARMNLSREKARAYIEQVDEDIRRWVRILYNVNWDDPALYDVTINAAHLSVENAAAALLPLPALPEFQATPAFRQALRDRLLASRCRLAVGLDERTRRVKVTVRAEKGNLSVTYLPRQAREAAPIPEILEKVEGVQSLVCTVATTNILLVGERFDPKAEEFEHLLDISEKWNAAIELVRIGACVEAATGEAAAVEGERGEGGILEDVEAPEEAEGEDCGLSQTLHHLIQRGRAGGYRLAGADPERLLAGITERENYSLVVVGEVFTGKGGARQRMKRDLVGLLADKFRIPVIGSEELKSRYLFGPRQLVGLLAFTGLAFVLFLLMFTFQEPILQFISAGRFSGGTGTRVLAALAVAVFIPVAAFSVGGFYKNLLKLVKLE